MCKSSEKKRRTFFEMKLEIAATELRLRPGDLIQTMLLACRRDCWHRALG